MTKKLFVIGALALAAMPAFATDLWDQQSGLNSGNDTVDQVFTDASSFSVYQVSDVIVGSGGWNVTSVSMEVLQEQGDITGLTQATLNVFANSGSAPLSGNDPTSGATVNISVTHVSGSEYLLTASGLNLNWTAGEYWVGLTPIGQFANGESADLYNTSNAAGANLQSFARNPGGGFGFNGSQFGGDFGADGTGWGRSGDLATGDNTGPTIYDAIDIQGTTAAPEPASMAFLGLGVVGILARRRNRK